MFLGRQKLAQCHFRPGPICFFRKKLQLKLRTARSDLGKTAIMEAASPSLSAADADKRLELVKQMRRHEVAVAELSSLSASRAVYQKHGNLFFRTTPQKATVSEQKLLNAAKEKMQKLNSP